MYIEISTKNARKQLQYIEYWWINLITCLRIASSTRIKWLFNSKPMQKTCIYNVTKRIQFTSKSHFPASFKSSVKQSTEFMLPKISWYEHLPIHSVKILHMRLIKNINVNLVVILMYITILMWHATLVLIKRLWKCIYQI